MCEIWKKATAFEEATEEMMHALNDWSGGEILGRDAVASARKVAQLATEVADEVERLESPST